MTAEYQLDGNGLGPLEYLFLDKLLEKDGPVDYTDFVGTAITLENIDEVAKRFNVAFMANNPGCEGLTVDYQSMQ